MRPLPVLLLIALCCVLLAPKVLPTLLGMAGSLQQQERQDASSSEEGGSEAAGDEKASLEEEAGNAQPADGVPGIRTTTEQGELEQVATQLLCSYRDSGESSLASSGYLDLFGSVWGCIVEGDGWVDVCLISEQPEDATCQVTTLRMEADELRLVMEDEAGGA